MTKLKLTLLAAAATLSLTNPASSFAADARMTHICTRKLRLVLRVLLLVWAAGSAGVLGSAQSLAQNAYIANNGSNDVSVIDTATNKVTATISVGSFPLGVTVTPDGGNVYVTNTNSATVSVIDPVSNKVIDRVSVGTQPYSLAAAPDGRRVYVANACYGFCGSVSVINTATNMVIATIPVGYSPTGVAVSPKSYGQKLVTA
jgi:YVTN family beta-propeller protein